MHMFRVQGEAKNFQTNRHSADPPARNLKSETNLARTMNPHKKCHQIKLPKL